MAQEALDVWGAEISAAELRRVCDLLYRLSGIVLGEGKQQFVCTRLARRLRELGLGSYGGYLDLVEGHGGACEVELMVDLLTTNKTSFYREPLHFAFLSRGVVPELASRGEPVRVWSAGCSSGEEAYSLAMCLDDGLGQGGAGGFRVLATDLSHRMLEVARRASYPREAIGELPGPYQRRYLEPDPEGAGRVRVVQRLRETVRVAHLNLLDPWPMHGGFDLVFCRNVMIYFDRAMQAELTQRLSAMLRPGGYLFVGHSEGLQGTVAPLAYVCPAAYRRAA